MADTIYWTNFADHAIRGARLAGSGNVDTLYDFGQGAGGPQGVAIDAAAGRIYWANQGDESIRGALLAGGMGSADGVSGPIGVAVDSQTEVRTVPIVHEGPRSAVVTRLRAVVGRIVGWFKPARWLRPTEREARRRRAWQLRSPEALPNRAERHAEGFSARSFDD